ncbi:MAG: AsnC family protein [Candidatus Aenigmatarchaeota archaeon]
MDLDDVDKKIVRELIRTPRISDNKISQRTKIPVMTVNRKRKRMEERNLLWYFTCFNKAGNDKDNTAKQLYIIKFRIGITKSSFLGALNQKILEENTKCHLQSCLGEKDGHLASILFLQAPTPAELTEVFNGIIIPGIKRRHGDNCIEEIITCKLTSHIRHHKNYLPIHNMKNGKIVDDWPDEFIVVE